MDARRITSHPGTQVSGLVALPGDKSLAHRLLILGSLARGTTYLRNVPQCDDLAATIEVLTALGCRCEQAGDALSVTGLGEGRYRTPLVPLDCGGSGTTLRLLAGALAGRGGPTVLAGDASLAHRPMARLLAPLQRMGLAWEAPAEPGRSLPLKLLPPPGLMPAAHRLEVASAQLKGALIIAGLCAHGGRTTICGALNSRDHMERLVPRMGGSLVVSAQAITVEQSQLQAIAATLPGDPSAGAFFAAAAALRPGSSVRLKGICTNPTRLGFFEALSWMGARVTISDECEGALEPMGDITVSHGELRAIEVPAEAIPTLIDEVPLLLLVAALAPGLSRIRGVGELRLKESDRIGCSLEGLTRMGARIECDGEDVVVEGVPALRGAEVDSWGDHRMAMMLTVAALSAGGESTIHRVACESKSFPDFYPMLLRLVS